MKKGQTYRENVSPRRCNHCHCVYQPATKRSKYCHKHTHSRPVNIINSMTKKLTAMEMKKWGNSYGKELFRMRKALKKAWLNSSEKERYDRAGVGTRYNRHEAAREKILRMLADEDARYQHGNEP